MKLQALGYALLALGLSLLGNLFLGWQWAGAQAECRAGMEQAARIAIQTEQARARKAEATASRIAATTQSDTMRAVTAVIQGAMTSERDFRSTPVTGTCRMPATPSLQPAIDAANAAGSDSHP